MALSPEKVARYAEVYDPSLLDVVERQIDEHLVKRRVQWTPPFKGAPFIAEFTIPDAWKPENLREEKIIERFESSGWKVEVCADNPHYRFFRFTEKQ